MQLLRLLAEHGRAVSERLRGRGVPAETIRMQTLFGEALVYETRWRGDRLRMLDIGGVHESATFLDDRWCELALPYLALYDCVFEAWEAWGEGQAPRRLCMLGGGGYAYPKHVVAHHPNAGIDVVEVDPAITQVARDHFFLTRLEDTYDTARTGRLRLVCADALSYLQALGGDATPYDAVLNDCFAGSVADSSLAGDAAVDAVYRALRPGGIYAANVIGSMDGEGSAEVWELVGRLAQRFAHVMVRMSKGQSARSLDNMLLVATGRDLPVPHTIPLVDAS